MAARLWAASQTHHDQVQQTPFVVALAGQRLPWRAYADWLAQLYLLHESLAQVEALLADPSEAPASSRSARVSLPALAADLRFLHGEFWQRHLIARSATTVYCTHLREIAAGNAVGLLAHHYARHIEDLYAATTLTPAVTAAYGLDDAGRQFLCPTDTDLWQYLDSFQRLVDTLSFGETEHDAMLGQIGQVQYTYLDILDDLGRSWS